MHRLPPEKPNAVGNAVLAAFSSFGPIGRQSYLLVGVSLALAKYLLDRALIGRLGAREWMPWDYVSPLFQTMPSETGGSAAGWMLLGLMTLPFLFLGVTWSMRRAVDAGIHPMVGLLFFVPLINYLLMAVLSVARTVDREDYPEMATSERRAVRLPVSPPRTAHGWLPAFAGASTALLMIFFSVLGLGSYGAGLFLGAPFVCGAVTGFFAARSAESPLLHAHVQSQTALLASGAVLLVAAFEGLICLLMALPLASVAAAIGTYVGWIIRGRRLSDATGADATGALLVMLLVWPILSAFEAKHLEPALRPVTTRVVIAAAPETVWKNVVSFGELPRPSGLRDWVFKTGIAYPVRARIEGRGVGAVRHCEFSTGAFVEPITVWDEPRHLAFDVVAQPAPMKELSPYPELEPLHLDHYLRSQRGEFSP